METKLEAWMRRNEIGDGELAKRLGKSRSQVTRLRNGSCKPSPPTAIELQKVTGIPAWELIAPDCAA